MIQGCAKCGAINEERASVCSFCEAPLAPTEEASADAAPPTANEGNLAAELEWRREVAHRLEVYRARRNRLRRGEGQARLPLSNGAAAGNEPAAGEPLLVPEQAGAVPELPRPPVVERMEIAVAQPKFDFAAAADRLGQPAVEGRGAGLLRPVAALRERWRAGLADAAFLLLAYGGFLGLFGAMGGQFAFRESDVLVYAAALVVFYAQYFALFTVFGGSTPGMLLRRLHVVSFDGGSPTPRQLLWRSFGYLVSGGTVFLGFLWALWDEDQLTWQDRISQTYLTYTEKLGESESRASSG